MKSQITADGALDGAAVGAANRVLLDQPLDTFNAKAMAALLQNKTVYDLCYQIMDTNMMIYRQSSVKTPS